MYETENKSRSMRIAFYADDKKLSQLANNGGTRTLLLSSQVLRELGHKVSIVAHKDRFLWFPHVPPVKSIPKDTEVLIAVTVYDIKHILKYRETHPKVKLFYWSRPWEQWNSYEEKCMRIMLKFYRNGGIIMSNSKWQCDYLKLYGIKSHLIYSGQDIECEFKKPDYDQNDGFNLTIGCQYSSKPRKGWKEFKKIVKLLGTEKYEYVAFGSEKCKEKFLSEYLRNPSRKDLNALYQRMDVFVCPSSLEGYFNPSTEASINGCLLLVNNEPRNGTSDIATRETAHIYNSQFLNCNEILNIFEHLDFSKVAKCQKLIREKIGTRKFNMEKMVEVLREA